MPDQLRHVRPFRTDKKTGIGFALLIAFGMHVSLLVLPGVNQKVVTDDDNSYLEVLLTKSSPPIQTPLEKPADGLPDAILEPLPAPEPAPEPFDTVAATEEKETPSLTEPEPLARIDRLSYETLSSEERTRLTSTILSAQFISQESVTEQIFGKPINQETSDPQPGFHIPMRQSMITMLDQPMPELPFAYTPGLVHFAYDPGVKGDLQRFWDVITPEFGWRTNNGTEFKCVWVLIVAGCGWK